MKKIQVLIITLVIILLLGCATFATLYFATDIFKSDKEMFYKYISQITVEDTLVADEYSKYQERLENEDNTNKGNISISVKGNNEELIDEEFDFETKSKPGENFASAKIDMKQNDEKKLTIDYLRNEDLYGLRFEDLIKQYIVLENNNLKEFAQKLGIENTDNIPNKIEIQNEVVISEEEQKEVEQIFTKYINIAIEQIPNENYSKLKSENITFNDEQINADGYQLTISSDLLNEILINLLNSIKEDEDVYNLLSKLSETELELENYKETIQTAIDTISEEDSELNITLKVYKQGKKTIKLVGIIEQEEESAKMEFSVEKLEDKYNFLLFITSDDEKTNMSFNLSKNINVQEKEEILCSIVMNQDNEEVTNITIKISREGKLDSQNIKSNFSIDINYLDANINIVYDNTNSFEETVEKEEFKEDDYAIINQFEKDQIGNLFTNLIDMICERIDEEKTILGIQFTLNENLFQAAYKSKISNQEATQEEEEGTVQLFENQSIEVFNIRFTSYEGVQSGASVKTLISAIEQNNITDPTHKIDYNSTITSIESSKKYNISFEKDSEGYISKAIIEEQ
jgi:hypothetical protein